MRRFVLALSLITMVSSVSGPATAGATDSTWRNLNAVTPARSPLVQLLGVSCVDPTSCVAVGYASYDRRWNPDYRRPLVERWDGSNWARQRAPAPDVPGSALMVDVSCASLDDCMAVGTIFMFDKKHLAAFAEHWDGKAWRIVPIPDPAGIGDTELWGVSCPTSSTCFAVGWAWRESPGGDSQAETLIERWDGAAWSVILSPILRGESLYGLFSVSCSEVDSCTAVGRRGSSALIERWNGSSWRIQRTDRGPFFWDVACPDSTSCMAVGRSYVGSWDGSRWTVKRSPLPAGADGADLVGVACATATACAIVGEALRGQNVVGQIAARWDGRGWTIDQYERSGLLTDFSEVTCPAVWSCVTVGDSFDSQGIEALAEGFDT